MFFKNRITALLLAALIVIGSSYVSIHVKLTKRCDEVRHLISEGVSYNGYKHPSITDQLSILYNDVDNFITFVPEDIDTSALSEASEDLRLGVRYSKDYASYLCYCYNRVLLEYTSVSSQMQARELDDRQQRALDTYSDEIKAIQQVVLESGYNEAVREFAHKKLSYSANLFAHLTNVTYPEYFE